MDDVFELLTLVLTVFKKNNNKPTTHKTPSHKKAKLAPLASHYSIEGHAQGYDSNVKVKSNLTSLKIRSVVPKLTTTFLDIPLSVNYRVLSMSYLTAHPCLI